MYSIALHGGIPPFEPGDAAREAPYREALLAALHTGQALLARGGDALEAVIATVVALEDCPLFNAGRGAAFTAEETHELDAGVMDGRTLAAGGVAGVRSVKNPILAAREVMRQGRAVFLSREGAEALARARGLEIVEPSYFSTSARLEQLRRAQEKDRTRAVDFGTVGAVARDRAGHLAAATSTGGLTNKLPSRIADTPIVGAGVYANDATVAVSCTGTGEHFMRACIGHDVHARIAYLGHDVERAAKDAIAHGLAPIGGRGGIIAVAKSGAIAIAYNSAGMYRAWIREGGAGVCALFDEAR